MKGHGMPTLDEARRINEDIIDSYLESNPGASEYVGFAGNRMQEALDLAEEASGLCAKAATLMCGVAWAQPFSGANKRTAVALARLMLNRNGYDLDYPEADSGGCDRLRRLLFEVQERRSCLDPDTVLKTQIYLCPRLKKREGRGV